MTELKVRTYAAAEPGIFVSSHPPETADRVVLADAGLPYVAGDDVPVCATALAAKTIGDS